MLNQFIRMMKAESIPESVIRTFCIYYNQLVKGERGIIPSSEINPPKEDNLLEYSDLNDYRKQSMLKQIVVIKLNGGLGTSMGLSAAKSLLPVKGNMNFLDIIVRQILLLRVTTGYDVTLMFMNSFHTDEDTKKYLQKYPDLEKQSLPVTFQQNKFPRIRQDNLKPYDNPDPKKRWNPPGHGDLYTTLYCTGLLDKMIDAGFRYIFVSNSDNLGATIDPAIPSYMAANDLHFVMEVCHRTEMDKKGGHLCEDKNGQLMLREIAQCPENELSEFQNIALYKYFNTNNLWIDLKALQWYLLTEDGTILLPLIVNPKVVDGTPIYQLETAMGAAISLFKNSRAVVVPRTRFSPVKKNNDLLAIWSDLYELNDQYHIVLKQGIEQVPTIELDERYYGNINQMMEHFKDGVPSLIRCKELKITGDISFGEDVICEGKVSLYADHPVYIKSKILTGEIVFN
ncbi:MAG TPA: UTP--glucose-1-phosphate uridylyltransferase [Candidatus Syntrophosphaera thermopropionivorans]|jgi:UTP--glucose-1-phosphate uridylyltransferase|nr:UTP--glucose-1-phosphate uridylyltransferase [Candidatus Syntrophosphaera thermopropionivorans]HOT40508.1 UTP--glucose-1-phosphate uridylyltransferase [Candidatus Syntrophosphaera thermopropionivorans]HPW24252.1 UTP--glucose-1-phosphate uridylyltransferase [Candidatus Syntrophosphaera thermopropionivorans]HQC58575.1 UTP--glucose-1-phosphate uridylyltransferase [Candidatus Syntrophosphaera thermopropionivorans]HRU47358.1 UTP--glucose-1-phosphate uridylyltransferase [Candidatus Syntrophosphaer